MLSCKVYKVFKTEVYEWMLLKPAVSPEVSFLISYTCGSIGTFWKHLRWSLAFKEAADLQSLTLSKKQIPTVRCRPMLSCEFCEMSHNSFFKEPFGRLLLHKHLSSFQKWCQTYFPAEYFLGLIWRLVTRVSSIF